MPNTVKVVKIDQVRGKLTMLVHEARVDVLYDNPPNPAQYVADYLIANGVTVQEWISVKDRLPEDLQKVLCFKQAKYGSCVMTAKFSECLEKYCDVDFHGVKHGGFFNYDSEVGYYELREVTHWMPLPQPPKGE